MTASVGRTAPTIPLRAAAFAAAFLLAAAGCKPKEGVFAPPPPPDVTVASPVVATVSDTLEYTGRVRGIETVEVRARVKGFLLTRNVDGGRRVKAGELLFTIDPRPFVAAVKQAEAELETMKANLRLAEVTLDRVELVVAQRAGAKQELDKAEADKSAAEAQVQLAEAKLATAQLDLDYTQVKSPIDGRVGVITVDPGMLVGAIDPTLLATVINDSKVYATYEMDERTIMDLRTRYDNKRPGEDGRPNLKVRLGLVNETGFPHEGEFSRGDNTIDPETGTVKIEAVFDNADGTILPGAFVRLQPVLGEFEATLLPDAAVLADQLGRYVLVVNDKNEVERRAVVVGPVHDRMRRIDSGVALTDLVIVNGLMRARPGMPVNPTKSDVSMGTAAPAASPASPAAAPAAAPAGSEVQSPASEAPTNK